MGQTQSAPNSEQMTILAVGKNSELYRSSTNCAIKFIKNPASNLCAELRQWKSLCHPNIIQCFGWTRRGTDTQISLQLIPQRDLKNQISRKPLQSSEIRTLARDCLYALHYLHSRRIVHGNISPRHILWSSQKAYLTDFTFRCAKNVKLVKDPHTAYFYHAPETFDGQVLQQSDLWALGVTLFFAATRHLPFQGVTPEDLEVSVKNSTPNWRLVSSELSDLLKKLLQKDPRKRPSARQALTHTFFT